jgi:alpha/beta hydrolase fold
MAWFYQQYLPAGAGGDAGTTEADLAHATVAGVAPAIVATAEFDPLRDEGAAYAARLAAASVPVEYVPGRDSSTASPLSSAWSTRPTPPPGGHWSCSAEPCTAAPDLLQLCPAELRPAQLRPGSATPGASVPPDGDGSGGAEQGRAAR